MSDRDRSNPASSSSPPQRYIPSEAYRAMLVRDGERRFREWHSAFLNYQKAFLEAMAQRRKR